MSEFSATEAADFFTQILALVTQSAMRNEPLALAIVGNYRDANNDNAKTNFQHVQGETDSIFSSICALVRGTFEHYKDNAEAQKHFRSAILKITDKYFMSQAEENMARADMTPQIHEILQSAAAAFRSDLVACRIIASGVDNQDGTIRVQQVCEGQAGPLALAIADIVTEFVRENRESEMFLKLFQREVNRAFEVPVPESTTTH